MAWNVTGTYWAPCSCKVGCPCALGEMEGDSGWCSGTLAFDIRSGKIDGVDVAGTTVVLAADWPSGFLAGNGKGRVYFDPSTSAGQRKVLEPLVMGKLGGALEGISALVAEFLPSKEAAIKVSKSGDETRIKVGDIGELVSVPLRGANGQATRLLNAAASFRDDVMLSKGTGTRWSDPDLRSWESAGHSEEADFDWSG